MYCARILETFVVQKFTLIYIYLTIYLFNELYVEYYKTDML